jgi:hypothetical protein
MYASVIILIWVLMAMLVSAGGPIPTQGSGCLGILIPWAISFAINLIFWPITLIIIILSELRL